MPTTYEVFLEMKKFLNFNDEDVRNLKALGPVVAKYGKAITDEFYETLGKFPATAKFLEGQIDRLKGTHAVWLGQLFEGRYDEEYFNRRWAIGMAHVRVGLDPYWCEVVMNVIRSRGFEAILAEVPDRKLAGDYYRSLLKILDLDMLVINLSYSEDRLDRMADCSGISRILIENLIKQAR